MKPIVPCTDTATRLRAASQALMGTKSGSKFCQLLEQAAIELESLSGPSHDMVTIQEVIDYLEEKGDFYDEYQNLQAVTVLRRWAAIRSSATPSYTEEK
jgi:hypothetical protein